MGLANRSYPESPAQIHPLPLPDPHTFSLAQLSQLFEQLELEKQRLVYEYQRLTQIHHAASELHAPTLYWEYRRRMLERDLHCNYGKREDLNNILRAYRPDPRATDPGQPADTTVQSETEESEAPSERRMPTVRDSRPQRHD